MSMTDIALTDGLIFTILTNITSTNDFTLTKIAIKTIILVKNNY